MRTTDERGESDIEEMGDEKIKVKDHVTAQLIF